ncbi:hypothetical protein FOPG_10035 [Fusarium oxysporum f. sp. conglutinans race 2 54008]|uniref:Uncharacterized protein n=3 Tax=Fusarium oxysporum f. sp. conglutinans TaxID=100902 RepID=A0A8H6LGZ6_FUSOX|nr:hypothetical protein FOXB_06910 [Fusarium oxysporum f. sp. conglutinans Fo5176]EXL74922.1 hypothetical protein FOPG_10035 [Fusarium oxysporum f. sp. conglutinans race 2 54008]KAF6518686.1 hypothetical protein HZS61_017060 [Fusarium oxysporum f. sp. conglutinans]KAG6986243.1 hypothetical protein FocnCong_v004615 [Fusarium oxysporum f. sp. conglutinans]KAI8404790.1 hypothetical protein FOFC_14262 [Fusarium oxysporum]
MSNETNTTEPSTRPRAGLVASSRPDSPDGYRYTSYPSTGHAIQGPWNDPQSSLRRQIIEALGDMKWFDIAVLRFGYAESYEALEDQSTCPVTILISVRVGSTTSEQGHAAILKCKQILDEFDLSDVEVDIQEATRWGLAWW